MRRIRRKLTYKQGFTLLEAMVSLAILAIGLIAVIRTFSISTRANAFARDRTTATLLAEQKMAELRGMPLREIGIKTGDFGEDYPRFKWQTLITLTGDDDIFEAVVRVFWRSRGVEHKVELATLLEAKPLATEVR